MKSNPALSQDTICAVSTPAGVGGIAVIRVSGPDAIAIVGKLWRGSPLEQTPGYTARYGSIIDPEREGEMLDQAIITLFRAPASFTGEDVVEVSVHGSRYIQRRLLQLLIGQGARLADPGEFTRRAFANGKLDLTQAEAVADVIASNSRAAHRLAAQQLKGNFSQRIEQLKEQLLELVSLLELELDFSEEEVEFASRDRLSQLAGEIHAEVTRLEKSFAAGAAIKDGIPVAIIGPTNAGKSSLLNQLLGEDRAIVSDIHGTTRDTIEDTLEIGDYLFRFIDTAGLRDTADPIEALGIDRSRQAISRAAIVIAVTDITRPNSFRPGTNDFNAPGLLPAELLNTSTPTILLLNKADLLDTPVKLDGDHEDIAATLHSTTAIDSETVNLIAVIPYSTKIETGRQTLLDTLIEQARALTGSADEDTIMVTNLRHAQALKAAAHTTAATLDALSANLPGDLIAQDLRATIHHLSTITGTITTPDILTTIFSRFCIGK